MQKIIAKTTLILSLATLALLVVFIAPISTTFVEHSKSLIFFSAALLSLVLFFTLGLMRKSLTLTLGPVTKPLLFLLLTTLATIFFAQDYPVEGLLGMGGVLLAFTILPLVLGSNAPAKNSTAFITTLATASIVVIGLSLVQWIGLGPAQLLSQVIGTELPSGFEFTIAGSAFVAAQILALCLVALVTQIITTRSVKSFSAASAPIIFIGLCIYGATMLPNRPTSIQLPSYAASWSVMLDSLKSPRSALIGSGLASYSATYQMYKPAWVNSTRFWETNFSQAANLPLTLATNAGILGLLAWTGVFAGVISLRKYLQTEHKPLFALVIAAFCLQLLLPFNTVVLGIQAIALGLLIASLRSEFSTLELHPLKLYVSSQSSTSLLKKPLNVALYLTSGICSILTLILLWLLLRATYANYLLLQSSKALTANDVVAAYEFQQRAVGLNPYLDIYHVNYSQTNLLIAIALSNKADSSDADKQKVGELIQQAVREAQMATALNPQKSQNWLNLAEIYQNLIGVIEDSESWTIQTYVKAIETDPVNPILRIKLATFLSGQKNHQQALTIYQQAIELKPDLAAGYYNAAKTLRAIETPESLRESRRMYQQTLVLIDSGSEEYITVTKEIEELEKYFADNKIPLEPETEQTTEEPPQTKSSEPAQTEQAATGSALRSQLEAPSITEQVLANPE